MTVTTTSNIDQYTADGVMSAYTFTFALLQAADLTVYINGAVTALAYTVAINSNGVGGTVTFSPTVPTNGSVVILAREVDYTQTVSIPGNANLREATLETMVDRVVMQVQQVKEIVDRSLHFVIGSDINPELEEPDTDTIPFFDGTDVIWRTPNDIFNEMEGGGYGDIIGPATSVTNGLPLFADATGKNIKQAGYAMPASAGSNGQTLQFNSSGDLVAVTPVNAGLLKSSLISSSNTNTLPSSAGLLSGTYLHYGDWKPTANGAWTIAHNTRIYVLGEIDLGASATITGVAQSNGCPAQTSSNVGAGGRGGGLSGGHGGTYQYGGGGGGGSYGLGGRGGYSAANNSGGDTPATFDFDAGGSGGGSGSGDGTSVGGKKGGDGGPAWSIECTSHFRCGNIVNTGGAGTNGAASAGAGGGGGGGNGSIRAGGNITRGTVDVSGGNGGNTSGTGVKGGGGGGGFWDEWAGGTITGGAITANGGSKGTGSAPTSDANAGGAGTSVSKQGYPPVSIR